MTKLNDPTADVPMMEVERQSKLQWNVQPSEFSRLCSNPIRKIVDNIKKPATSNKTLIRCRSVASNVLPSGDTVKVVGSNFRCGFVGDPTVFGNLHCPDVLVNAIVRNTRYVHCKDAY